jgi:hypothetical protein
MTDADGLYIMTILSKGNVRIRHEEIRFEDLGKRIEEVFRTRAERLLLVRVEGQVEFGDVVEALDRASSRVQLRFGLMTERTTPTPAEPRQVDCRGQTAPIGLVRKPYVTTAQAYVNWHIPVAMEYSS